MEKQVDPLGDPYEDYPEDADGEPSNTELLKISTASKDFGNQAFKNGDFPTARTKYQKGLRYIYELDEVNAGESPTFRAEQELTTFALYHNMALASLKVHDYKAAIKAATGAINVEGITADRKAKAFYRRGLAHARESEDDALADLQAALLLAPEAAGGT